MQNVFLVVCLLVCCIWYFSFNIKMAAAGYVKVYPGKTMLNLPKIHGRQTRRGGMKVGPDPAQVAGSSADFDFGKDWE